MADLEFTQHLAAAAREMAAERGTQHTLDRAVRAAVDLVEHCDLAGLSVAGTDGIETRAATGEQLRRIDQLQFEIGEGPCLDAVRETEVVTARDLGHDDRWPTWGRRIAEELDVHSSISYRLFTDGHSQGALNLYATRRDAFDHEDLLDGLTIAAHVAVALAGTLREDQLTHAMHTRTVIGQATGMLMERFTIDADRAFAVLQRVSSHTNTKLHRVAVQVVETGQLPEAAPA